jgi:hypothetical protein
VAAPDDDSASANVAARGIPDKSDVSFDGITIDEKTLKNDKSWAENGTTSLKQIGPLTMAFSRMVGMAWESGAGYAVARKVSSIADPSALLAGADDSDQKAVPIAVVAVIALLGIALGIGATVVEHTLPVNKLVRESRKFAKGDQDALPVAKLSGPFRKVGQDVNDGVERVIQKGGGASRKAADLEQILGPVPAAPQMSAFSFNLDGGGSSPSKPSAPSAGAGADLFPNLPPAGPPGPPPPKAAPPTPAAAAVSAPVSSPGEEEEDDATMVQKIPDELMAAAKSGESRAIESADEIVQWRQTFDEFVAMRAKCGEPTTGLSFEKFQVQLRKNKEQLVKQYNCRRVKFTVYEKDGKAALKATPIKD